MMLCPSLCRCAGSGTECACENGVCSALLWRALLRSRPYSRVCFRGSSVSIGQAGKAR